MTTLKERVQLAMARRPELSQADLARAAGIKQPSVADWLNGKTKSLKAETARKVAALIGCDQNWLGSGVGSPQWREANPATEGAPMRGGVAQLESHPLTPHSPLLTWGEDMNKDLPPRFRVAAPDDSMAPRVRAGEVLEFQTGLPARPGDGVLVQDDAGNFYFRLYRERRPGHWEAHAISDAYQALDSQRDGLRVLAVLTAVYQRWG